jgi:thiol-disulfide isomerase/thioredoxin
LAEDNPQDSAAVDALLQIVVEIGRPVSPNDKELLPHYMRALDLLIRDHLDDERLATAVQSIRGFRSPSAERFLRAILERGRDREVRAAACMNLARSIVAKRGMVLKPWFDDPHKSRFKAFLAGRWDSDVLRHIRESDPQALSKEAEELYERAIKEFGDVVWWKDPNRLGRQETITDAARMQLNDLRLSIGAVAPEIEGQDIDGLPMKLSDHRGKVVVLSFWGSWCGPCMAVVPRERSLIERLAGRRFVLLGVNSDKDRGHAKEVVQKERLTWRSWWDGIPPGPIATRWGVRGWPTLYVIDAEGVIRYKAGSYDETHDKAVYTLLEGIESDKPR